MDDINKLINKLEGLNNLEAKLENIQNDQIDVFVSLDDGIKNINKSSEIQIDALNKLGKNLTDSINTSYEELADKLKTGNSLNANFTKSINRLSDDFDDFDFDDFEYASKQTTKSQTIGPITQFDFMLNELKKQNQIASRQETINAEIQKIQKLISSNSNALSNEQINELQKLESKLGDLNAADDINANRLLGQSKLFTSEISKLTQNLKEKEEEDPLLASLTEQLEAEKLENERQKKIDEIDQALTERSNLLSAEQIEQFQNLRDTLQNDDFAQSETAKEQMALAEKTLDALEGLEKTQAEANERQFRESKVGQGLSILEKLFPNLPVAKIGNIVKAIQNWKTFLPVIANGFKTITTGLKSAMIPLAIIIATFEGIRGFIKGFQKQEGNILQKIIRGITTAIGQIVSTFIGLPLDLLKGILSWLLKKFGFAEASKILDSFKFAEVIFNAYDKVGEFLANTLKPVTEVILTGIKTVLKPVGEMLKSTFDYIKGFFGVISGAIIFIKGVFTGDGETMKRGLAGMGEGLSNMLKGLAGFFASIIDYAIAIPKKLMAWLLGKMGFENISKSLEAFTFKDFALKIVDSLISMVQKAIAFIVDVFKGDIDIGELIMSGFKGLVNMFKAIGKASGAALKAALPGGESPKEAFVRVFQEVLAGGKGTDPQEGSFDIEASKERAEDTRKQIIEDREREEKERRKAAKAKQLEDLKSAVDSGLYDKTLFGKSEIDKNKITSASKDQLSAILKDDDLSEKDKKLVQDELNKRTFAELKEKQDAAKQGQDFLATQAELPEVMRVPESQDFLATQAELPEVMRVEDKGQAIFDPDTKEFLGYENDFYKEKEPDVKAPPEPETQKAKYMDDPEKQARYLDWGRHRLKSIDRGMGESQKDLSSLNQMIDQFGEDYYLSSMNASLGELRDTEIKKLKKYELSKEKWQGEISAITGEEFQTSASTTGAQMEALTSDTANAKATQEAQAQAAIVNAPSTATTNSTTVNNVTYTQTAHVDDTARIIFGQPSFVM